MQFPINRKDRNKSVKLNFKKILIYFGTTKKLFFLIWYVFLFRLKKIGGHVGTYVGSKVKNFWKIIWIIMEVQDTNFISLRLKLSINLFFSKRVGYALALIFLFRIG